MKKLHEMSKEELIVCCEQLQKRKKYGLVWEDKPEDVVELCKEMLPVLDEVEERAIEKSSNLPTNLIIEGDNYHALSVLNYTHKGKIDVIYIDPPYNTGAKDWKYNNDYVDDNDRYRHSKWISMMHNRLKNCKNLLRSDGVLIVTIDHNEQENLGILLRELFPEKEMVCVVIIHNPAGIQGQNFSHTHEYAYFVFPKGRRFIGLETRPNENADVRNFRDVTGEDSLRGAAKNCFYPILVKKNRIVGFGDVCPSDFHPPVNVKRKDGVIEVYPVDPEGVERKWRFARQTVESIKDELIVHTIQKRGVVDIKRVKNKFNYKTVWTDSKYSANNHGTQLLNKILGKDAFSYPKSLYAVIDCIQAAMNGKKSGVILDFFAGSGTTGHAVLAINNKEKEELKEKFERGEITKAEYTEKLQFVGKREFILCTNNENKIAEEVTYPRIKAVINGYSDAEGIPANLRYFKTSFVENDPVSDDTRRQLVKKSTEMICVKEGTFKKKYDNKNFKIYENNDHVSGILFNLDDIEAFKKKLNSQDLPAHIYVFSLTNDTFDSDFDDLEVEHTLCPIPESILEVYRKIFS